MDSIEKIKKKILLIVNPCSGKTKTRISSVDIMNQFPEDEYEFTMKATTCQGDATNIVKNDEKLANKPEKVLAGIIEGKVSKNLKLDVESFKNDLAS